MDGLSNVPVVDPKMPEMVDGQFKKAEQKLKNLPKKAKKKIKPQHYEALRKGRQDSVSSTKNAVGASLQAK